MITTTQNKKLDAQLENKAEYSRVPTGRDGGTEELRVRIIEGDLDLRIFRRSPDSFAETDWHPTTAGVTLGQQYAETLIEQVAKVARLAVTVAPRDPPGVPDLGESGHGIRLAS
jgi:hypothetical protein